MPLRNWKKKLSKPFSKKKKEFFMKNLSNFHTTVDTGVDPHLLRNYYSEFLTITFCGITGPCANQTTAECKCDILCIEIYAPVCGTDGKTYSNDCHMRRQACIDQKNITVSYQGECSKSNDLQLLNNILLVRRLNVMYS